MSTEDYWWQQRYDDALFAAQEAAGKCARCLDEPIDPDFTDLGLGRRCADDWSAAATEALAAAVTRHMADDERDDLPVQGAT